MTPNEQMEASTWDMFWLPPSITVVDRPELMVLHTPRPLPYLNSVYRTRAAPERLPALIDEVRRLHANVESRWLVFDTIDTAPLEAALAAADYQRGHEHDNRVTEVATFVARPSAGVTVRRVCDEATLRDCWRVSEAAFARDGDYTDDDVPVELARCAAPDARVQRFVAYIDGEPVSSGGMNLYPALGLGFLWAGGTVPSARGRGAYSAIVAARVARARARGLARVGVYARAATSSPIVAAQGFAKVGRLTYWQHRAP